jgi:hypothetical protein
METSMYCKGQHPEHPEISRRCKVLFLGSWKFPDELNDKLYLKWKFPDGKDELLYTVWKFPSLKKMSLASNGNFFYRFRASGDQNGNVR